MKLKVCGLKEQENVKLVLDNEPDYVGFIFYEKSPRYAGHLSSSFVSALAKPTKVGVFVNASCAFINEIVRKYGLDMVQVHGDESVQTVAELHSEGHRIIKVFRVEDQLPGNWSDYKAYSEMFLFDTKSKSYGGTGRRFDWTILGPVDHPFLLSGGIGIEEIAEIRDLKNPYLVGIDVNSRVEVSPGNKDIEKVKQLKQLL